VDIEPKFKGDWSGFLSKNLIRTPQLDSLAKNGIFCTSVIVNFMIDTKGRISNFPLASESSQQNKICYNWFKDILMKTNLKWTPAFVKGKKVKAWHQQQIYLSYTDEED
jgi:hypothetical protein